MAVEDVNKYSMFLQLSTSKYVKLEKDTLHGTKFIELKQMNTSKNSQNHWKPAFQGTPKVILSALESGKSP